MANTNDTHWVLLTTSNVKAVKEYTSRRAAIKGAKRSSKHWPSAAVVSERGDELEVWEAYAEGKAVKVPLKLARNILKTWNAHWSATEANDENI